MKIFSKNRKNKIKDVTALSVLHEKPSVLKIATGKVAIVLTVFFWISYITSTILRQFIDSNLGYQFTMEAFGYAIVVSVFTFSALIYLITRQGALQRFSKHIRVPRAMLEKHFTNTKSAITVLVPSYSEEPDVVRKTMLSAALQEYPDIKVVLLLDDNPNPTNPDTLLRLNTTRDIGNQIQKLLSKPYKRFKEALSKFEESSKSSRYISPKQVKTLATHYQWAASWLNELADKEVIEDHVDQFFADQVLRGLAGELSLVEKALLTSIDEEARLTTDRVKQLYNRLVWIFGAELKVFERKRYASLSHEANKAMNLNSYIGLMGGTYKEEQTPDGLVLVKSLRKNAGGLCIPDTEFLLTLDADSVLLRDYCLRLVYFLQQPGNERVAVTQTPYSSFPNPKSPIERLAGATTDIQHILHQGMSHFNAAFWVGANAVIRKKAIEDIVEKEWVGGFEVKRYVQDRTVIEDTESSVDLALHNWRLVNYPERLSYSATPPDFGSLVVQRRRWANGGLLIMPKLLSYIQKSKNKGEPVSKTEIIIRSNYMGSIAWSSLGLVFMLAYPYDGRLLSPLVFLAALPYYIAMAHDLKYCGYKYSDIFRIYGFNLILLPVNLAGVIKSIEQALTDKKIPFARTPKVKDRTATTLLFVAAPLFIIGFSLFTFWRNISEGNWVNAAVAAFNAITAIYAVIIYIGVTNLLVDLWIGLTDWLYVEHKPNKTNHIVEDKKSLDWKSVLYHGEDRGSIPHSSLRELTIK